MKNEGLDRSRETLAFGSHPRFGQPAYGWLRHPHGDLLIAAPLRLEAWAITAGIRTGSPHPAPGFTAPGWARAAPRQWLRCCAATRGRRSW